MKKAVKWLRPAALTACTLMAAATVTGAIAAMPRARVSAADDYTVDLSKVYQDFDGWGLSLSWWATELGDWTRIGSTGKEKREEIMEALYGPTGLNLNIARYNVGGGDNQDPSHKHMSDDRDTPGWRLAHSEKFEDAEGGEYSATVVDENYVFGSMDDPESWIGWEETPDWKQLWALDWIQNNPARAEDYISEYYSNSPPYWMTITGCSSGGVEKGQNLDFEYNQAFVEYFLDVYEYLTAQGFRLDNLQPFNESGSYYWGENGDQEGCYFSPQQKVEVLDLLVREMEARGLDVPYNVGDETNTDVALNQYSTMNSANASSGTRGSDILNGASRLTYHIYDRKTNSMQELYRNAKSRGQDVYMSEVSYQGGAEEYDPTDLSAGFAYTGGIVDTIKNGGVDAYVFWQGMEDMVGQIKGGTNWGLIQGVYYTQEEAEAMGTDLAAMGLTYQDYVLAKAYYMSGQFTKYIRPGYRIIDVTDGNALAAVSPDGETLVIVKNNNGNAATVNYNLKGFKASSVERVITDKTHSWDHSYLNTDGRNVADSVPANSVVTYVIKGERTAGDGYFVDDSAFQNIGDLATAQDVLLDNSEAVQFYSNFELNGGEGGHYGQTTYAQAGKGKYAVLRFYGTGFALTAPQKDDAGQFDFYIDTLPASSDPTASKDLYSADTLTGAIAYRNNSLEEGWHTVWLIPAKGSVGEWVNLDGVHIYTSSDKETEGSTPVITAASGVNGKISFEYRAEGFEEYTLTAEVLEQGAADWRELEEPLTEGKATFAAAGKVVRIRIKAEKDGQVVYSPVRVVELLQVASREGVLYYVDCGTADPGTLSAGTVLGELQSAADKAYGEDLITGQTWGYKGTFSESYYGTDEAMSSMWPLEKLSGNGDNTAIEYAFNIPAAGEYKVAIGFFGGGDGWGQRGVKATVGGEEKTVTIVEETYSGLFFDLTTTGENEEVTVRIEKSSPEQNTSQVSVIVITEKDVKLPLYTTGGSELNQYSAVREDITVGDNIYEKLSDKSFDVYYTDGTQDTLAYENADVSVEITSISANQEARANFAFEEAGITCYCTYRWLKVGGMQLYYNIDCGYTGSETPPDDGTELGTKQSTTHDREYGTDSGSGTSWGYVGTHYNDGVNWANDPENKWSIREGVDGDVKNKKGDKTGGELTYKMTGFVPDEPLRIEVAGHCSNWGTRAYDVLVNETKAGTVTLINDANPATTTFEDAETVKADANGELEIKFTMKAYEGDYDFPQVAFIKVYSSAPPLPVADTITADKTEVSRDDAVTLSALNTDATVYVYDDNKVMTGSFKPTAETQSINVSDYLRENSKELRFVQAVSGEIDPSAELVLTVKQALGIEIEISEEIVKGGEYAVAVIKPVVSGGVTSLSLLTPDGAEIDLTNSFYFRTRQNGTYTVTLLSGGETVTETFTVNTIDNVTFGVQYSETGWTSGSVSLTFAPAADGNGVGSIVSFAVDGQERELTDGKFVLEVTENGTHTAAITTAAGYTYEETYTVGNIDKSAPALDLELGFTPGEGLTLDFAATTQSGGELHVSLDGTEVETNGLAGGVVSLERAGKYELWFVSGAGAQTQKAVYYVTHGTDKAQLYTVSVAGDGTVTVSDQADYKLYRAGEETPVSKAEKAGKYYLELTKGGETEIVVFTAAGSTANPESTGVIAPGFVDETNGESSGSMGGMIAGIVIGGVALLAACAVCITLVVKGRKKS